MLSCLATLAGAQSALPTGDERILAAREALRTGDRDTLDQLAASKSPHVLERYVDYWRLHNVLARTEAPDAAEIEAFLARYAGSVVAERLRAAWLRRLADDEQWLAFIGAWGGLEAPDDGMRCLHWLARLHIGDSGGLDEAAREWRTLDAREEACETVIGMLADQGRLGSEALWARFREQMAPSRVRGAEATLGWLPAAQMPDPARLKALLKDPDRYLSRLHPGFERDRAERELALAAIGRLARSDPKLAYMRFVRIADRFPPKDRAYGYVLLGWRGAQAHLPQAIDWFRAAGRHAAMNEEQRAWQVRAALRFGKWKAVRAAILEMGPAQRARPVWVYWLARAEQALGHRDAATALFARIPVEPDFYSMLAQEALGHGFAPPAPAAPIPAEAMARAQRDPDLRRALALFRLDLYTEGVREWNWRLRHADSAFRLAAARVALKHEVYDRAINTAEFVSRDGEYELRFITPYRELIEPQAKAQGLDLSWVYGLMRQESRFVHRAASSAGAQGLMQVMPRTGQWVARKIGLNGYRRSQLAEPETNVLLGTSYMRIVLDDLADQPVLASAGYNAGPSRAKRWRDDHPLEGAIYVETIPFDETRHYVKQVMENAVVYAAMMEKRPQSLKARLGVIDPD
ncbi:lytic transglycosylase domain-containing protein [Nitrogeniibacter mangrovi]|uniref:Lytic transglycosylase domain-containing protein n=2 Tax=Nitrogeniibacter mangrovi TaxID=2016596 RepID=A0A6C1B9Z0_9RHOO|nr:lytic transglycosylase domain-containing protein [Nitrogeniibacter mangrovi]